MSGSKLNLTSFRGKQELVSTSISISSIESFDMHLATAGDCKLICLPIQVLKTVHIVITKLSTVPDGLCPKLRIAWKRLAFDQFTFGFAICRTVNKLGAWMDSPLDEM